MKTASQRLIDLLSSYQPADETEANDRRKALQWLATTDDPLNRNRFDPGHAVGSALIATPDGGHVLLVLHAKLKRWLQPGGHAEPGENDLLAVARREALEEVGCDLDPTMAKFCDLDIHAVPARPPAPQHLHFDFRFHFPTPRIKPTAASDALQAQWFTLDETLGLDLDPGLRRMIGKLRVR